MVEQPYLHELACVLKAPIQVWSRADGNVTVHGAQGIYAGDDRVANRAELRVPSHTIDFVSVSTTGDGAEFRWLLRTPQEGADPVVALTRHRHIDGDALVERLVLTSAAAAGQSVTLEMDVLLDATPMSLIKAGLSGPAPATRPDDDLTWHWRDASTTAALATDGVATRTGDGVVVRWDVDLDPGTTREVGWRLHLTDAGAPFVRANASVTSARSDRVDLARLLDQSIADLDGLLMAEAGSPEHYFAAAGSPWYLTLFGRDSLITAHMLAKTNPRLALATLRTLAAHQGRVTDVDRAEQPGKILHEVRRETLDLHEGTVLPPEYYGTIDATLLWIMLLGRLAENLPDEDLSPFAGPLVAALGWLRDHADADGDGLLEYFDESGHGLTNQGWKDSGDAIRFADGTIAEGPIVLVEVQGYAWAAARAAARLLPRVGRTDEERAAGRFWDDWADAMAERVRDRFWVEDELGAYLALALDGSKRPVTGVASNMGHLLGLGILTPEEEAVVVRRLMHPSMFSGYGIRTLSTTNGVYWPLRYHGGSVWTHDTAWIIAGMHAAGFAAEARLVAEGLLRAAAGFNDRLPELFCGDAASEVFPPLPYPASCRPQAWAAASAFVLHEVLGQ